MKSIGSGNMMVLFLSAAMLLRVWRYLSWRAVPDWEMTSAASFRDLEALCSPSAAITCHSRAQAIYYVNLGYLNNQ